MITPITYWDRMATRTRINETLQEPRPLEIWYRMRDQAPKQFVQLCDDDIIHLSCALRLKIVRECITINCLGIVDTSEGDTIDDYEFAVSEHDLDGTLNWIQRFVFKEMREVERTAVRRSVLMFHADPGTTVAYYLPGEHRHAEFVLPAFNAQFVSVDHEIERGHAPQLPQR